MKYLVIVFVCITLSCSTQSSNDSNQSSVNTKKEHVKENNNKDTNTVESDLNKNQADMIYFEGGYVVIGSNDGLQNEFPAHEVHTKPFYIDKHLVTVTSFRKFIQETGYKTEADNFGDAGVFSFETNTWGLVKGANWEFPLGPDKPMAEDDHPVTQVSWNDAVAYSKWAGKRLPTEYEWEYAAKNGSNTNNKYSWGDKIYENGKFYANVWQGDFNMDQGADGFIYTSPVGYYGETKSGLTDMGGNVWQWCSDVFKLYPGNDQYFRENSTIKSIRGGSFFYDEAGELSYTVAFRSKNSYETSLFNTGFRCAKSAD